MELFGTAGIRGDVTTEVTPERGLAIGRATGRALDGDRPEVVVARDGRETGTALVNAVAAGLQSAGCAVVDAGMLPTPALAFASQARHGVMVTASHNPPSDNGIKLFRDGVEFDRNAEQRVADLVAASHGPAAWQDWGQVEPGSPLAPYRRRVAEYARSAGSPLQGIPIAVDCGNGMASLAAPQILRELGGRVAALNANVDGRFPGRESKPTPESLADLREFVETGPFEFGIGHDGDADRIVIVDATGEIVHEDTVLAVLAEHYTRESASPDPVVVTTPNASARIDERVAAAGGQVERCRLGALHEGITAVRDRGQTVVFAAEPWKHIHPAFGGWIDGVASGAVIARLIAAEGLADLRAPVAERPYRKANVACEDGLKAKAMAHLQETLPAEFPAAEDKYDEGIRLDLPDESWILVRPSGTEPYLRIYVESERVDELLERVKAVVTEAVR